jgi:hypothetical protein
MRKKPMQIRVVRTYARRRIKNFDLSRVFEKYGSRAGLTKLSAFTFISTTPTYRNKQPPTQHQMGLPSFIPWRTTTTTQ